MGAAAEVPDVSAAMMAAVEMRMTTAMSTVAAAVATAMTAPVATATLGDGISGARQRGRQSDDGNPDSEL